MISRPGRRPGPVRLTRSGMRASHLVASANCPATSSRNDLASTRFDRRPPLRPAYPSRSSTRRLPVRRGVLFPARASHEDFESQCPPAPCRSTALLGDTAKFLELHQLDLTATPNTAIDVWASASRSAPPSGISRSISTGRHGTRQPIITSAASLPIMIRPKDFAFVSSARDALARSPATPMSGQDSVEALLG